MTKWEESDCIDCPGANIKNGLIKHEMSLTSRSLTWAHVMPNGVEKTCWKKKRNPSKSRKESSYRIERAKYKTHSACLLLICSLENSCVSNCRGPSWGDRFQGKLQCYSLRKKYFNKVMIGFLTLMELLLLICWPD